MGYYEVEVKVSTARALKNVNWRHGPNRPYVVVWVEPSYKLSTLVDEMGDVDADWDETLVIPLPPNKPLEELTLHVDVVHAGGEEDTEPLIGSARLELIDVKKDAGIGQRVIRNLALKRPSGRPQGNVEVSVTIRDTSYSPQGGYYAPPYGTSYYPPAPPQPYSAPPPPPQPYSAPPPPPQPYSAPPPPPQPYSAPLPPPQPYSAPPQLYNAPPRVKKESSLGGMGTGLAVGAVAGVLGGIALVEGAEYVEDTIAEDVKERVERDLEEDYDDTCF